MTTRSIWRTTTDERGSIAIKFALMLPVVLIMVGIALDHARFVREQSVLQGAVDAAALAAAKELSLSDSKYENLPAIAEAVVAAYVKRQVHGNSALPETITTVSRDPTQVDVSAIQAFEPSFGDGFGLAVHRVRARATARVMGQPNICVLGLNPRETGTISLEHDARVTGQDCAVYSNSSHTVGINSKNDATLRATVICSAGGVQGGGKNFDPAPMVDCPTFDDPLASRPEPSVGACDPNQQAKITANTSLDPGTYCGLEIASGAEVTLRPGVFVIKDKPLIVRDGGKLFGDNAGLFFSGPLASFTFERLSTISLSAPTSGPMAGLLLFAARSQSESLTYQVLSDDARVMVGTIYIPKGELRIDATSPIADQSAYTAVVADKMRLYGGPNLVLNANYNQTEVPVPDGIKGAGQPVALTR